MQIITHPGQAHRDDFMAICFALNSDLSIDAIHRRNPTEEELQDEDFLVIDVGGRLDPRYNNYDHHQFGRDAEPMCALTLILEHVCHLDLALARKVFNWLEWTERMDSKGPFQTAEHYRMAPDLVIKTVSPIEVSLLRQFAEFTTLGATHSFFHLMQQIGFEKIAYYHKIQARHASLSTHAVLLPIQNGSFYALDLRYLSGDADPALGVEAWLQNRQEDIPVVISNDDRGPGYALFRRNDDNRIDFSRIEDHEDVLFAHKGGFVAKTTTGADPTELIQEALTSVPAS